MIAPYMAQDVDLLYALRFFGHCSSLLLALLLLRNP